ncbi:hypothetical protein GGF46_000866 [Coemansia sp. RSA 552]|nr:hypothetical protein GGF46_000866 [Coemansia sp. RSA 552]
MSFRFNFGSEDGNADDAPGPLGSAAPQEQDEQSTTTAPAPYESIPLSVPHASSIVVDAIFYKGRELWKRQIDDVQFQLAQQDSMDSSNSTSAVKQAIASDSNAADVIKGEYEGGLKTWECSMDLLGYLVEHGDTLLPAQQQLQVLELGCGTALPSLHILATAPNTRLCMQDYNRDVLELITIPNVLANSALVPSSEAAGDTVHFHDDTKTCEIDLDYRRTQALFGPSADEVIGARQLPELSPEEAQEADSRLLQDTDIGQRCEFISGDWTNIKEEMTKQNREHTFDLVITSETIYDTSSYKKLHDLLEVVLAKPNPTSAQAQPPMVLVAAKSIYFGLTGSVLSFEQYVRERRIFDIESIWQSGGSMGREILRMTWHN